MQNKAAQIVTRSPPRAEWSPMYNRLGWLTVNQLVFYHSVLTIYKIRSSKEPEHLASSLLRDNRNGRILIPNVDLRLTQTSFTIRGAENWNSIPIKLRLIKKIGPFKKQVKKWVKDNVPQFLD